MNKTLHFTLEVEVEIDGDPPSDEEIINRFINGLNDGMPTVIMDADNDDDYAILTNSWEYENARESIADDTQKTKEINILVAENRKLIIEIERLKKGKFF